MFNSLIDNHCALCHAHCLLLIAAPSRVTTLNYTCQKNFALSRGTTRVHYYSGKSAHFIILLLQVPKRCQHAKKGSTMATGEVKHA